MYIRFTGIVKNPFEWMRANRVVLLNTGSLIGATAAAASLGFVYWLAAARQYTPESVGLAVATISAMMLLGSISVLGLGTLLITELPRQLGQEVSLISTALAVVGGVGGAVGVVFAVIAPYVSPQFAPLRSSILDIMTFAAGVSLTAVTTVLDQALIGLLQGGLQFWRNVFFSMAKLVLLFAAGSYLSYKTGMTIYTSWTVGMALSLVVVFVYTLFKKGWQGKAYLPQWKLLRRLGPAALQHHLLNLALAVPTQLLPVLVTVMLSAKMNAWFYVSWMLANFVFVVPAALTAVLHAMNSAEQASLRQRARMTIGTAFIVSLAADAVLFLGAKQVLGLFGSVYAEQATWSLQILLLAVFPAIIKYHYISFCRIHDHIARAIFGMVLGGLLELGGAALGAYQGGLLGLDIGWLFAVMAEGLFMLPFVYKIIQPTKDVLEIPSPDNYENVMPIWLLDTAIMGAISPLRPVTSHLQVRVPTTALREVEPTWLVDTIMLPVIRPVRSGLIRPQVTSAPCQDNPFWHAETIILPDTPILRDTDPVPLIRQRAESSRRQFQPPYRRNKLVTINSQESEIKEPGRRG